MTDLEKEFEKHLENKHQIPGMYQLLRTYMILGAYCFVKRQNESTTTEALEELDSLNLPQEEQPTTQSDVTNK